MIFKRGVSEVVANVLIVLLVVVGVAVLWAAVKPTIERTADTVQSDCFNVQLEIVKCEIDFSNTNPGAWDAKVTLKRNPGQGDLREVVLDYKGSQIYYSPTFQFNPTYSTFSLDYVKHLLDQQTHILRKPSTDLRELETKTFSDILGANDNFNSQALSTNVFLNLILPGPTSPATYSLSQLSLGGIIISPGFIPSSITVRAVVGDGLQICDIETIPASCACFDGDTASFGTPNCQAIMPEVQNPPVCTSLPCTINLL